MNPPYSRGVPSENRKCMKITDNAYFSNYEIQTVSNYVLTWANIGKKFTVKDTYIYI